MSIEKMVLLKVVGSTEDMNPIIKELILNENVHLNLNVENSNAYANYYVIHQYESDILGSTSLGLENSWDDEVKHLDGMGIVENLAKGMGVKLTVDKNILSENYKIKDIYNELMNIESSLGVKVKEINDKREIIKELQAFRLRVDSIGDKTLELNKLSDLNCFEYEIGMLSKENKWRLKKNYENLSAIVMRIGIINASDEDMYMIMYPKQFKGETDNLLKSLNWSRLERPEGITGTPLEMIVQIDERLNKLNNEIDGLTAAIEAEKKTNSNSINRLYNILNLEERINEVTEKAEIGNNIFAVDVWVQESELENVKKDISKVSKKYMLTQKTAEELGTQVVPPTKLKNNIFAKPFETIVKMYSLPAYNELDPTPFLAVTFCLAFGIMFGDIGQGLVYFLLGLALKKKIGDFAGIVMRLGATSIVFGFVYGSFFGLEKHELPWLPSLIQGGPLSPDNIPMILVAGIVYGLFALTVSYIYGIVNSMINKNIEEGIFGKNGIFGYMFFMSFVLTIIALTGIINVPVSAPLIVLLISIVAIVMKEPLANLVMGHKPLFHESPGAYFTESIFEAIETILAALSNTVSFVRVGAFALNHAGLFMAFLVMSEMVENIFAKILILVIGNILILTLEGVIVFIQGLRLQYYEMFSKYFKGEGVEFKPLKLTR
ncbi:MAG: V-type ATPase 116kDa subunit family protein [Sedimentibacter saalensis]|jgi:V/A-type H+-transporting ATPase subunit I|uniref:V-type ATP synthase subunit I n=1 Tax=Sedimentibacter saalensis TaxID=130788 RepID=UPI002B1EC774|nr:V-type ATPase 116kDa subunit family protein [Sedimentibacter saalensis]MEA5094456.1 V-type ATPase 116kDa subunit family protein [Sedimentibacter saalensis]